MPTVNARTSRANSHQNTVRSRRKNHRPRQSITCSECMLVNDCDCLSQLRLIDLMAPLARQVLEHLATDGSFIDDEVLDRLAILVDRNDQREREHEAQWNDENSQADRDLIDDVVGPWNNRPSFRRDVEGIAALRKVPVGHVRALVDRFLRESRPESVMPVPVGGVTDESSYQFLLEATASRRAA